MKIDVRHGEQTEIRSRQLGGAAVTRHTVINAAYEKKRKNEIRGVMGNYNSTFERISIHINLQIAPLPFLAFLKPFLLSNFQ